MAAGVRGVGVRATVTHGVVARLMLEAFLRGGTRSAEGGRRLSAALGSGWSCPALPENLAAGLAAYWRVDLFPNVANRPSSIMCWVRQETKAQLRRDCSRYAVSEGKQAALLIARSMEGEPPAEIAAIWDELAKAMPDPVEFGAKMPGQVLDLVLDLRGTLAGLEVPKPAGAGGDPGGKGRKAEKLGSQGVEISV